MSRTTVIALLAAAMAAMVSAELSATDTDPVLLFTDPADAAAEPWGLMQAYYNRAQPINATALGGITAPLQAVGLNAAVLVRDAGPYVEVFSQGKGGTGVGEGIYRMQSSDGMRTWTDAELVIDGTACAGCEPKGPKAWFVNAQNMGYRSDTGEYLTLIYGGKAKDYPGSPFTSHGALGFILRSKTGLPGSWTCDGSAFGNATCDVFRPTTIDHDDGSMTFDHVHSRKWVNAQVVLQNTTARVLPSGYALRDNSPGRRVIGWRTSDDGRNWSCAPSIMDPFCDPTFGPDAPVTLPRGDGTDPPELQWYRARPFRYGDRWAAAVYNYAPSPLCDAAVMGCHGPHMGTSWWINRGALADHAAWTRPYRWQRFWRRSRVMGPHAVLNHAPLRWKGWRLWLAADYRPANPVESAGSADSSADGGTSTVWYGIPEWRLGGIYSPANAQFQTRAFALPAAPLSVNADTAWQVPADQCDPLNELCQAYVMAALLDAGTGKVIPGYEAEKCVVRGVDGTAVELRWNNATTAALETGRKVRLRFTIRDSILYSVTTTTAAA